jgi:4-hydroxythreonine-4-phosphate dehydrogenase
VVIGDPAVYEAGERVAGLRVPLPVVEAAPEAPLAMPAPGAPVLLACRLADAPPFPVGEASPVSGRYVLETMERAVGLAKTGTVEAICFAPLNKQAMHLAGSPFGDELHWFAHALNYDGTICELNTFDRLWTTRVTSHIALAEVTRHITGEGVLEAVVLADRTLRAAGYAKPRVAVAALNPHGGEGGLFGREELDVIGPAVEQARERRIAAHGPFPSDTVFIKARDGEYDAVVTMYHDQGQIAMKLMGFDRGVTVQGGLPLPVTTPAHGTAFDIVGQGRANVEALSAAFRLACTMAENRRAAGA